MKVILCIALFSVLFVVAQPRPSNVRELSDLLKLLISKRDDSGPSGPSGPGGQGGQSGETTPSGPEGQGGQSGQGGDGIEKVEKEEENELAFVSEFFSKTSPLTQPERNGVEMSLKVLEFVYKMFKDHQNGGSSGPGCQKGGTNGGPNGPGGPDSGTTGGPSGP